ncbi:hypothetical protein NE852_08835 [Rhizobium sp. Pop5]|uniref:hypothetical protein n=1 Tax=Rhizobium sp. Pop5 TaxID=1223565 RepID=UPI0005645805|nr:hypothetical protein [Rhizobium sp. Pop5]UVD58280.1 hypothetical protein NE852_08835 [Rhizobium sp. Pop5]
MSFLYLVVMVAANTKYSINSLLSPVLTPLFLEAEKRARNVLVLNRFRYKALVLRPVFQKGTGLVTSGPVAAATSGIVKFETADSVKGWLLIEW